MKIPGSDGNDKRINGLGQTVDQVGVRRDDLAHAKNAAKEKKSGQAETDSVKVSEMATFLKQELDPTKMAAERQSKIDQIKKMIAEGKYNPSSESVAKALSDELTVEILLNPDTTQEDGLI